MKQFLVLSKENINLANSEVIELLNLRNFEIIENYIIFDYDFCNCESFLAYTNKILELLFRCKINDLSEKFRKFNWNTIFRDNFSVKVPQNNSLNEIFGKIIFNSLNKPKVKLNNPKTPIEIYFSNDEAFICLLKKKNDNKFEERKSHKRPSPHPSSLHPKLARAMINLLGNVDVIIDPFCGSGGILIEGALIKHKVIGIDIDETMIKRCYNNLKYYKINNFELRLEDSTKIVKLDYFVTDLPYGKNTKSDRINNLYENFFRDLQFKKAVVGFPDFYNYKKLLEKYNIQIKKEFDYYIHKNLKKKILLLTL